MRSLMPLGIKLASALLTLLVLVWAFARRRALTNTTMQQRRAIVDARVHTDQLEWLRQQTSLKRPQLVLQLEMAKLAESERLKRLRELAHELQRREQRAFEERQREPHFSRESTVAERVGSVWHSTSGDGRCPAYVPQWDWQLLLSAAATPDGAAREQALADLATQSGIAQGVLSDVARRYATILGNKEFDGILDPEHPECTGERFASLEGDRILRIDCDESLVAQYALDDESALQPYRGPVRIAEAESVIAFCGERMNLLSHPRRRNDLVDRARAARNDGQRKPSVLVFMIDATSRAHFRRSMPKTLAALEAIAKFGASASTASKGAGPEEQGQASSATDVNGKIHIFDFEHYNVVGYNSMPNQLPLFCGTTPEDLSSLAGERCVWEMFKRGGAVTMMAEEIHDACDSATTTVNAVWRGAYSVQTHELPDHQWWRLFCSRHIKPCCWAKDGFLNPGRRQCVGGSRTLSEVMIGYLEEFWSTYGDAPRRWAAVNTMVAHEHFMLRLPSLDADLAAMLLRMAGTVLQDTVVLLLSDHGTHGIWYTDYEIGQTEHQLPFMYMLAPDWIMQRRPGWLRALTRNQRRLVTVHEIYNAMRVLAAWPDLPSTEASGPLSLFDEIPEGRTCKDAGIPEVYCACRRQAAVD